MGPSIRLPGRLILLCFPLSDSPLLRLPEASPLPLLALSWISLTLDLPASCPLPCAADPPVRSVFFIFFVLFGAAADTASLRASFRGDARGRESATRAMRMPGCQRDGAIYHTAAASTRGVLGGARRRSMSARRGGCAGCGVGVHRVRCGG
ncbi:hypothetical protein DFH06DRAFT_1481052 [Mycena polygramma]|nr:hypothetical protein DFH06DRAFT_1481052 [Mycena polygramma]